MPSKAADDMFAVEDLVHEIKENLRLKAPSTSSSNIVLHHRSLRRPSPYSVPSRSYVATPSSGLIACIDPSHGGAGMCGSGGCSSRCSGCSAPAGLGSVVGNTVGVSGSLLQGGGTTTTTSVTLTATTTGHAVCAAATRAHCLRKRNKSTDDIDDPYEMLQALLKNNSLVKEAVRRLQLNLPKQRYFYESDEESRSPMMRMCQLEL